MTSPTQRSLKELRGAGWRVIGVEYWNNWAKCRQDLYGFADLLATRDGDKPKLIQVTTSSNMAARRTKILNNEHAPHCLRGGFTIEVHGWGRYKVKRGGKATVWRCRIEEITLAHFEDTP